LAEGNATVSGAIWLSRKFNVTRSASQGAVWPEGNPGEVGQPEVDQLKLAHPEDIEKATELYGTWRANQAPARSE